MSPPNLFLPSSKSVLVFDELDVEAQETSEGSSAAIRLDNDFVGYENRLARDKNRVARDENRFAGDCWRREQAWRTQEQVC